MLLLSGMRRRESVLSQKQGSLNRSSGRPSGAKGCFVNPKITFVI